MANWELKLSRVIAPIRGEPMHTLSDARAYIKCRRLQPLSFGCSRR
jgi:hypothetical protein